MKLKYSNGMTGTNSLKYENEKKNTNKFSSNFKFCAFECGVSANGFHVGLEAAIPLYKRPQLTAVTNETNEKSE